MQSINKITKDDLADSLVRDIELGGGSLYGAVKRYVVEYKKSLNRVSFIGNEITDYNPDTDTLEVFMNTVRLTEGQHYNIDPISKEIIATSEAGWAYVPSVEPSPNVFEFFMTTCDTSNIQFGVDNLSPEIIQMISSKQVLVQCGCLNNTITVTEDTTRLPIIGGEIAYYDSTTSALNVYVDGHKLIEDKEYIIDLVTNEVYIPDGIFATEDDPKQIELELLIGVLADNRDNNIIENIDDLKRSIDVVSANLNITSEEVQNLKSSVSDGKKLVAAAITGKGIPTAATDSFTTMSNNINSIIINSNTGNATPDTVLKGYTFSSENGSNLEGTIPVLELDAVLPNTEDVIVPIGYLPDGLVISGDNDLIPENIRYGKTIFTIDGSFTEDADITPDIIPEGIVAYAKGKRLVGTKESYSNDTIIPTTEDIIIPEGTLIGNSVVVMGDENLNSSNIKAGTTIFGVNGEFTSDATANPSNILHGETAYANGRKITGTITSIEETTIIPNNEDQVISHGRYIAGDITIKGTPELSPENIRDGVEIFGVTGTAMKDLNESSFNIMAADAELKFEVIGPIHSIIIATSTGVSTWIPNKYLAPESGLLIPTKETKVIIDRVHITLTLSEDGKSIKYTNEYGLQANAKAIVFYM